jgi:hypothetical protein
VKRNAHWLVAKMAREMAESLYEAYASDNRFYEATHKQEGREHFVRRMSQELLEDARALLARQLGRYDVSDQTKDQIHQALLDDNELRYGRKKPWHPINSQMN